MRTYNWDDGTNYHALPISWFWSNIEFVYLNPSQEKASVNYTAIQYLFVWLFYLIVAVPEFIFWIVFLVEDQESCDSTIGFYLFNLWASYFGLYGSWILYSGTVIMPILQLERLKGEIDLPMWTNAIVQLVVMVLSMLITGTIHILFVPALNQRYEDVEA